MKYSDVINVCEEVCDIPAGSIMSHKRTKNVTLARALAMYTVRRHTNLSLNEISIIFKRHITAVTHNVRKIELSENSHIQCNKAIILSKLEVLEHV